MNSDVDETFGLSRASSATETPDCDEMTPNVSPGRTVQYRFPDAVLVVVRVVRVVVVVVVTCLRGVVVGCASRVLVVPDSSPDRMSRTASVTASRKAAGAAYRR